MVAPVQAAATERLVEAAEVAAAEADLAQEEWLLDSLSR